METNLQPKSLSDIAEDFIHDITPGELEDLLQSVRTLKNGSGWGSIILIYKIDLTDIDILIKRKPKKEKPYNQN